jgi:DOPA 4,5-dioxygenase
MMLPSLSEIERRVAATAGALPCRMPTSTPPPPGPSPWAASTASEPTPRPLSVRPGEQSLPALPRKYTDVESYHAHVYFDEDSYAKAALIRRWVAERFTVELGHWNVEPRGPHVTPSFYFGFTLDLLPVLIPWLQLNSLGLTILIHPNTEDPRADHLHYALWVNRAQPVDAYAMTRPGPGEPRVAPVRPNTTPTVPLER